MSKSSEKKAISILAIDLAKNSFQLHAVDCLGEKLFGKKMTKQKLKEFAVKLPPCIIAMEACGSSHYWARLFESYGHQVKLIAPQFVKPFVKSNKNDAADAAAIAEAAQRPDMRFVSVKTVEQQDDQCVHRIRSQIVKNRTALVCQIRGLLMEYGIDIPLGRSKVRERLPYILEDATNGLSIKLRDLLLELYEELKSLDNRVDKYDEKIEQMAKNSQQAQLLTSIPGIGAQTATALLASIGDISVFKNGRELAAYLGLVPRQHSTGGKPTLLGISKRGDVYLRTLLIHGARAVLQKVEKKVDKTSQWAYGLIQRRGKNKAAVALANKNARIVYALLSKNEKYQPITDA